MLETGWLSDCPYAYVRVLLHMCMCMFMYVNM